MINGHRRRLSLSQTMDGWMPPLMCSLCGQALSRRTCDTAALHSHPVIKCAPYIMPDTATATTRHAPSEQSTKWPQRAPISYQMLNWPITCATRHPHLCDANHAYSLSPSALSLVSAPLCARSLLRWSLRPVVRGVMSPARVS